MMGVKKGDIVLITTAGGSPMGGKKLAEVLEVYPMGSGELVNITGLRVYVFTWKKRYRRS